MAVVDGVLGDVLSVVARNIIAVAERQAPSQTESSPAATSTVSTPPSNNNNNSGSQSPLLFFVALGFGVVFTNLWIIVGVKYCFRYNARNRALARGENPDELVMDNMPTGRPHRRRREKKLMTMDDVNERFPLTKYKAWMASRANEGLPTAGGVDASAAPSRAASLRRAEGVVPTSPVETKHSVERPDTAVSKQATARMSIESDKQRTTNQAENKETMASLTEVPTAGTVNDSWAKEVRVSGADDSEDEDARIHDAMPVDVLDHPGDSCAICIDTLEQDEDVRGLTCGHAFHAGCIDPWLTSRRACCPLCKADYYVPKPKPEVDQLAEGAEAAGRSRRGRGAQEQPQPAGFFISRIRNPWSSTPQQEQQRNNVHRSERSMRVAEARAHAIANVGQSPVQQVPARAGTFSRLTSSIPLFGRRETIQSRAAQPADVTPQQLEAGNNVR